MSINIEVPEGSDALNEFLLFHDRVYEYRSARWPAALQLQMPILTGDGPYADGRKVRPFAARADGAIVARVTAIVDDHYIRHWNEPLGHLVMFEALPDTHAAVKALIDAACGWLADNSMTAARAGFGLFEFPFVIDDYETLPPSVARQNPAYYHNLLKGAGFESEQGWVDYKIEVSPDLVERYGSSLEACRRAGFEILPLCKIDPARRVRDFTHTWNDAFKAHWGATPFTEAELAQLFQFFQLAGGLDTSVIAYQRDSPVGALMVLPESSEGAIVAAGRQLKDSERLNFLGIGVSESARGRGVNLAMASYAYLELINRGAKYLSYTLVLDDNWPSRRTAEKLGATVCANYMVYRRNFRR
ncbi:MAG TPA: GNAT family N-acetyltransferase [Candidatus Binataceae bacterium]